ncbi:MAG: hypothetical protein EGR85_08345 [Subdoligranulum sp.]|nr:hypothetical protein [Subdoligranulum sp.]
MSRYFTKTLGSLEPYVPGEQLKIDNLVKLNGCILWCLTICRFRQWLHIKYPIHSVYGIPYHKL